MYDFTGRWPLRTRSWLSFGVRRDDHVPFEGIGRFEPTLTFESRIKYEPS